MKRKGSKSEIIIKIVFFAFLLLFLMSIFNIVHITYRRHIASDAYSKLDDIVQENNIDYIQTDSGLRKKSMDFSALKAINQEVFAWISSEGMGMDYPVMYTDNNEYYLEHLYDGTYNANGTLFIDCNNSGYFNDDNTVIYGHNMKDGSMFHELIRYKKQEFYDKWPTLMIYTENGDFLVELICGTVEDGNDTFVKYNFTNEKDFNEYIDSFIERSTFTSKSKVSYGDKIVSLCTCTYEKTNARYMLIGKLLEIYE